MVYYKRKKNSRLRGSTTHGWGAMKKHRGAGNRGGRGMAGTGKRGDAKKPSIWADEKYFGKYGFFSHNGICYKAINVGYFEENADKLASSGAIKQEAGGFAVNLEEMGYNKLLSSGNVTRKFMFTAPYASRKAIEKVTSAGGKVEGLKPKKEKKAKSGKTAEKKPAAMEE
ncbi:uL15 family ribosomal protein [Candidatus Woesearchaeota archaeon]|nr:uL15 family ribosomal protein [Candidatus Woesearchaeota archaeon]